MAACYASFVEMRTPKSTEQYRSRLGSYVLGGKQTTSFQMTVEDALPSCRSSPDVALGKGRGIAKLNEIVLELERSLETGKDRLASLHSMATVAKPVTAALIETRIADICGQCDTASLLTPDERTAFENRSSLLDPDGLWPELLPGTCYMVPEAEEDAVAELLLSRGAAKLVAESDLPVLANGALLLNGAFLIEERPGKHRFINDLRKGNLTCEKLRQRRTR